MKILHIVPSYKPAFIYGGTIESVARLCEGLAKNGIDVTVFTTTANGEKELEIESNKEHVIDNVKVFYFKRQTKDPSHVSFALLKKLYKECKGFDIVHIHSWWNILVIAALWICKQQKVKTIISPHGMFSGYIINNSNSKLKQFVHNSFGKSLLEFTTFHATSEPEFEECKNLINGWNGFVVPNILSLPDIQIHKTVNDCFTIVFLSRIHPKKGIEILMKAISKSSLNFYLQIAGTGKSAYINQLKQRAKNLNISQKIKWLGWKDREEKFEVLMKADLFALTSYNENFANVVIEALYVGTPVILSDKVGLSNFVATHNLGWICNLEADNVCATLEEAYNDNNKRIQINNSSNYIIQNNFSESKLISEYIKCYRMILKNDEAANKVQYA